MKLATHLKGALPGAVGAYVNSIAGFLGIIIQSALAVRYLSHVNAGIWMLMLSLVTLLNLSDFGLSPTLSRLVSFSLHLSKKDLRIGLYFNATQRVNLLISTIVIIAMTAFLYVTIIVKKEIGSTEIMATAIIFLLAIYFRLIANPNMALIFGLKQVARSYKIRTTGHIINLMMLLGLCLIKTRLLNFPIALLSQYIVLYVWSSIAARTLISKFVKRFSTAHFKNLLNQSFRIFLMGVGAYIIYDINTPILSLFVSLPEITKFAVLLQVISLLGTVSLITQSTTIPFISSMYAQKDISSLKTFVLACMKFNMIIASTVCIFLFFHASQFFYLWLGPNYVVNKNLFLILLIVLMFQVQDASLVTIAIACGYLKFVAITLISGIINIALIFIFVPHFGITGAGISIIISQLLTNNWFSIYVITKKLKIGLNLGELFKRYFVRLVLYIVLLILLFKVLINISFFMYSTWVNFIVIGMISCAISFLLAIVILLTSNERKRLQEIIMKRIKKQKVV